jgi:hypothetical protein
MKTENGENGVKDSKLCVHEGDDVTDISLAIFQTVTLKYSAGFSSSLWQCAVVIAFLLI